VRNLRTSAHSQIANTPVIFLSADSSASTVGEALPLGVAGYIVKPPSLAALDVKIELALNGHKNGK
jgi:two-component system chemotaxis response regulator CheY